MKAPSLQLICVLETPAFRPDFLAPSKASDASLLPQLFSTETTDSITQGGLRFPVIKTID